MSNATDIYPIQLDELVFLRCSVIAVPGHEPGAKIASPDNHINVTQEPDDPRRYRVQMRTLMNQDMDKAIPYAIDMECLAFFTVVDPALSAEDSLRGVTINGNSVCYGAIRETVAWLTGRQAYGRLLLGLSVLRPPQPDTAPG